METKPKEEKKSRSTLYLFIILLLLGTNLFVCYLFWKENGRVQIITVEKDKVEKDAEIVRQELIALQAQYQNLEVNNQEMQSEIDRKKMEIEQLQKELEKHKDNEWIIAKLKKETQTLRAIMQHFVVEIDSLNTLNKTILADREMIRGELKTEKEKNTVLSKENEGLSGTVKLASMLKATGLTVEGVAEKKGGKKESVTNKAKRADKIRIKFTLAENIVSKPGERTIYARIVTPDGKELTQSEDPSNTFTFNGSKGYWASKKNVDYQNQETTVTMYAHTPGNAPFAAGKYVIEVATEETTIGAANLTLE